jgi:hypothetical protein
MLNAGIAGKGHAWFGNQAVSRYKPAVFSNLHQLGSLFQVGLMAQEPCLAIGV